MKPELPGKEARHLIQPDARGRILLPVELRAYDLYELVKNGDSYFLRGIQVPISQGANALAKPAEKIPRWLPADAKKYLREVMLPKIVKLCAEQSTFFPFAIRLYGSQARGDANTQSDFDFAVLTKRALNFNDRKTFGDQFEHALAAEKAHLEKHRINGDLSLVYLNIENDPYPPLYFSVAEEGVPVFDSHSVQREFRATTKRRMESQEMKKRKVSHLTTWTWGNS